MNKKYIDFVPARQASTEKTVKKEPVVSDAKKEKREVSELDINEMFEAKREKRQAGVTESVRKNTSGKTFEAPKARFVNTEKVAKRPLSKNVYPKKIVVPEETERLSKPVTIIDKPEKDSKVSLIVAIIITIILGAAAGTIAFLLLPK